MASHFLCIKIVIKYDRSDRFISRVASHDKKKNLYPDWYTVVSINSAPSERWVLKARKLHGWAYSEAFFWYRWLSLNPSFKITSNETSLAAIGINSWSGEQSISGIETIKTKSSWSGCQSKCYLINDIKLYEVFRSKWMPITSWYIHSMQAQNLLTCLKGIHTQKRSIVHIRRTIIIINPLYLRPIMLCLWVKKYCDSSNL